ncbi:MAG: MBL fold metallo-hydrolase [Candidatus Omnitrophota bacterium]
MKIRILYDNTRSDNDTAAGLGFSCLIDNRILFDTGPDSEGLKRNFEKFQVDPACLEAVVLSHEHWDHVGGLGWAASVRRNLKVYICPGFSPGFKKEISALPARIIEAPHFVPIVPRVYSTGAISGTYKGNPIAEQSMIIYGDKGFSVITGCAHPGIIKVLNTVRSQISPSGFYVVLGGFHLKDHSAEEINHVVQEFKERNVKIAAPQHCTGEGALCIFEKEYQSRFLPLRIGEEMEV